MSRDLTPYLQLMAKEGASDLFFSAGAAVGIKIHGVTRAVEPKHRLSEQEVYQLAYSVMNDHQAKEFERTMELNLAIALKEYGRFRINVYRQRGAISMVVRYITNRIPSIDELNLPPLLNDLIMEPRGLILVVGTTGSGKSTTLASMIDHRNNTQTGHILTIEDPIEYLHEHKKSIVDQRELGLDTISYANALKNAMREAPDVILIGEIRDRETMEQAIAYAETGHLCLSTLHANNARHTIERVINFFPETAHHQVRIDLSQHLHAVISQRLIKGLDGKRVPAVEIMLNTPYISDLIQKGEIDTLRDAMEQGTERGMQTFDQSLFELYKAGRISREEALANADSRNDLGLRIRLDSGADAGEGTDDLSFDRERSTPLPRPAALPVLAARRFRRVPAGSGGFRRLVAALRSRPTHVEGRCAEASGGFAKQAAIGVSGRVVGSGGLAEQATIAASGALAVPAAWRWLRRFRRLVAALRSRPTTGRALREA
ncbi:MAG: PilT/PilU family type 4a pilus ATPase [Halofilum sp. (in: g-proteobacteria)]|nr:PilT/PilU family type 4a pilus ATPase [Halofilum sp. (in: g-proteobacteria)]